MPGRTSRTVVHIIRAATYDGQGVETDLWESDLAPPRKQGGRNTHRTPKGTAPPPDPTGNHATGTLPGRLYASCETACSSALVRRRVRRRWKSDAHQPSRTAHEPGADSVDHDCRPERGGGSTGDGRHFRGVFRSRWGRPQIRGHLGRLKRCHGERLRKRSQGDRQGSGERDHHGDGDRSRRPQRQPDLRGHRSSGQRWSGPRRPFFPPTAAEITQVKEEWDTRTPEVSGVRPELDSEVPAGLGSVRVRILSHTVGGLRHYGAVVTPVGAEPGSLPVILYAHGGDGGVEIEIRSC